MKTTIEYLDAVKAKHGIRSDYALAIKLEIGTSGITNYRKKHCHFNDIMAIRVAKLLEIDPAEVLAAVNAERTKCPDAKKIWERVARSFSGGIAAVILSIYLIFSPSPSMAQMPVFTTGQCILCQIAPPLKYPPKIDLSPTFTNFHDLSPVLTRYPQLDHRFDSHEKTIFVTSKAGIKPDQWTRTHTVLEIIYIAVALTDWAQTRRIAAHPDRWREYNPLLDDHPTRTRVDSFFITTVIFHAGLSYALPPHYRTRWQAVTIAAQGFVVARNFSIGLKIGF